ncbi:MAG: hypothetical protein WAN39_05330 [Candidatus Cybelea sp.]
MDVHRVAVRGDLGHRAREMEELPHVDDLEEPQDVAVARNDRGGVEAGGFAGFVQQRQLAERSGIEIGDLVEIEDRPLGIGEEAERLAQLML